MYVTNKTHQTIQTSTLDCFLHRVRQHIASKWGVRPSARIGADTYLAHDAASGLTPAILIRHSLVTPDPENGVRGGVLIRCGYAPPPVAADFTTCLRSRLHIICRAQNTAIPASDAHPRSSATVVRPRSLRPRISVPVCARLVAVCLLQTGHDRGGTNKTIQIKMTKKTY